jgi:cytochrome c6
MTKKLAGAVNGSAQTIFLLALVFAVTTARAAAYAEQTDKSANTFKGNCASCHGADGAGTALGKTMQAPDLRSEEVQKLPDSELVTVISEGKNNMPPFKQTFSADQIRALVKYVRSLPKAKAAK